MDFAKKCRRATRAQYTKIANLLEAGDASTPEGEAHYILLEELATKLATLDGEIEKFLVNKDGEEAELEKEFDDVATYKLRWLSIQNARKKPQVGVQKHEERNYKLPRLEIIKFDGNLKSWLPFWGQFEKIHLDEKMNENDKLQYLKQSMTPSTEVSRLIDSYPVTSKSYQQVITDLKDRYARNDLLIQVYVRELLTMILNKDSNSLTCLYDQISTQLRALEILGVTQEGYSSFILPMVESAIPLETLKAWERARPTVMNAPTAAWWGGFFERLIRIMKDLLKRILGQSCVNYEELETILCECEAVMNQRPLTYIQDDKNTCLEPLTPACFLQCIPHTDVSDLDAVDANSMNSRLKYLLKLRIDFKQRFKNEYLTALVQRGKENTINLNVGDIVLIETEEKRIKWPLGIIKEVYKGKDGNYRTAKVKTSSGFKIRPFQRLYPLEMSSKEESDQLQNNQQSTDEVSDNFRPVTDADTAGEIENIYMTETGQTSEKTTRCGRAVRMPNDFS